MRGCLGHGRNQSDCGGAAADNNHALAGVVQVSWPELRMYYLASKRLLIGEFRSVALIVTVVTSADRQQAGLKGLLLLIALCIRGNGGYRPQRRVAGPAGMGNLALEADVVGDA